MSVIIVLGLVVAAFVLYVAWMLFKTPDQNNDGKVDAEDVVAAAKEVVVDVKAEATEVVAKVKKARKKKKTA
jgi:flagellar basal body-associated protein FliL